MQIVSAFLRRVSKTDKDRSPNLPSKPSRKCGRSAISDLVQATAALYNQLGLPEYEAIEAFVKYNPDLPSTFFSKYNDIEG